ncbi:MAG TPA: hypothetical protein VG095_08065 [Chthoniobacterales bacterium]|nr:hypothetical protein [Chthoniobacterales bacterium]
MSAPAVERDALSSRVSNANVTTTEDRAPKSSALSGRLRHIDTHLPPPRPVLGLEAEFTLFVDDIQRTPEQVFGTPARFIRQRMIPRTGRSFQLPSGGAIYFDTGVIEVATPIIELGPGCCYRVVRLLWEQIRYLRRELDAWGKRHKRRVRLQGFSAHYNFSFPAARRSRLRNSSKLAYLLTHILPAPVALLAANRESSAIGVRPRGSRLEITADFTPDPSLMLATCGLIAGMVEGVLHWEDYGVDQIERHGIPRPKPLRLRKHSSRRGWRVLASSLQHNPFTHNPNAADWKLRDGRSLSLRQIAAETMQPFREEIRRLSDAETLAHIEAVFAGDARSLLDFRERPSAYDDVGHDTKWNRPMRHRRRSQYEEVIHRVIARRPMQINGKRYTVQRMQGWYEVVFREAKTGRRRVFNLDDLVKLARSKIRTPRRAR